MTQVTNTPSELQSIGFPIKSLSHERDFDENARLMSSNIKLSFTNYGEWDSKTFDGVETEYLSARISENHDYAKSEEDFNIVATITPVVEFGNLLVRTDYTLEIMTGDSRTEQSFENKVDLEIAFHNTVRSVGFTMDKMLKR